MGRRRIQKAPITTIAISINTADIISRLKTRSETQDGFIMRVLTEWQDLKDYRLDMDQVIRLKDRQISTLRKEVELKNLSF
ncbi:MAG: hypothetical protein ACE5SW_11690 [Nitrososphaeraceae archaeon]